MEEIDLDLNIIKLFGYQRRCYDRVLESIIKGIEMGDSFPPVPVEIVNGVYRLDQNIRLRIDSYTSDLIREGGHHRAVAHYITNTKLKAVLTGKRKIEIKKLNNTLLLGVDKRDRENIWIGDIMIVGDKGEYWTRKSYFSDYR